MTDLEAPTRAVGGDWGVEAPTSGLLHVPISDPDPEPSHCAPEHLGRIRYIVGRRTRRCGNCELDLENICEYERGLALGHSKIERRPHSQLFLPCSAP